MKHVLPVIVISQFLCTSLWFAGNAVMGGLIIDFRIPQSSMSHLISMVQFGFISGTLIFALLSVADRFSPSKVFFTCAILGAVFNLGVTWDHNNFVSLLTFRFLTGFFLAGIYPVGMKIAADYFEEGLGKSLGYLVGALVLGTSLPHLLKGLINSNHWQLVLYSTSTLACFGGLILVLLVPDGPYRKPGLKLDLRLSYNVFKNQTFRTAAFGYFGHMWELYAFWTFIPIILSLHSTIHIYQLNIPFWSFAIIGIGGIGCIIGGYISKICGVRNTAFAALLTSGACCLISPLMISINSPTVFITYLLVWGIAVVTDSPLFSTMVAQNTDPRSKGTALTIVNCIGFLITIFSIQLLQFLNGTSYQQYMFVALAIGPILGLVSLGNKKTTPYVYSDQPPPS